MTDALMLLQSQSACLIAPAGCGKTHLIADAVARDTSHRSLILTHTHAGVEALRKRLKKLGAESTAYEVSTIASWCLKLANSFPVTSGVALSRPSDKEWDLVYAASTQLLNHKAIQEIIRSTFDCAYVDEYQDCTIAQHRIIVKLRDIIPTRVLGDPLQGIFGFRKSQMVDWETDVRPHFEELPSLNHPHRWTSKNTALGQWLLAVRTQLEDRRPIDLSKAPRNGVTYVFLPTDKGPRRQTQFDQIMQARCPLVLLYLRLDES